MKLSRKKAALIFAAAAAVIALALLLPRVSGLTGSRFTKNVDDDSFTMKFYPLNGSQTETFAMNAGDAVEVVFDRTSGMLSASIGQAGKAPVYQGDDVSSGSFIVTAPDDGAYEITVTGRRAEGSVSFLILRNKGE